MPTDTTVTKHCVDAATPQEAEAKLRRNVTNPADWYFEEAIDGHGVNGSTRYWFTTR